MFMLDWACYYVHITNVLQTYVFISAQNVYSVDYLNYNCYQIFGQEFLNINPAVDKLIQDGSCCSIQSYII